MTQTSLGFSMAAMMRAAKTIFSQVLPRLMRLIPERGREALAPSPCAIPAQTRDVPSDLRFQT